MLIRTLNMQRALLFSMKPMPPMSAARLKTTSTPATAFWQAALSLRSRTRFSTDCDFWYQS